MGILGLMAADSAAQSGQPVTFGDGASMEIPLGWRTDGEVPEGYVFVALSADGNMTTNVQEEKKSDYEDVRNLAEFYQISVEYYTDEVWPDLDATAGKEGEINGVKAVFGIVSPTLDLGETKLATKGYLMVFENEKYYYTVTILSAVSRYERNQQALLNILRSFKAP